MFAMVRRQVAHDALANEGLNVWWIVGNVMLAGYPWTRGATVWDVVTLPAAELTYESAASHGFPYLRVVASLMTTGAVLWAAWTTRRARHLPLVAALAAFGIHAFATIGPAVHENHLFARSAPPRDSCRGSASLPAGARRRQYGVCAEPDVLGRGCQRAVVGLPSHGRHDAAGGRGQLCVLVWHAVVLRREATEMTEVTGSHGGTEKRS